MDTERAFWKTVIGGVDPPTRGIDKPEEAATTKTADINKAAQGVSAGHKGAALLRKTYTRHGVELLGK